MRARRRRGHRARRALPARGQRRRLASASTASPSLAGRPDDVRASGWPSTRAPCRATRSRPCGSPSPAPRALPGDGRGRGFEDRFGVVRAPGLRAHRGVPDRVHHRARPHPAPPRLDRPAAARRRRPPGRRGRRRRPRRRPRRDLGPRPERLSPATGATPPPPRRRYADGWLHTGDVAVVDGRRLCASSTGASDLILVVGLQRVPGGGRGGARAHADVRRRGRGRRRRAPAPARPSSRSSCPRPAPTPDAGRAARPLRATRWPATSARPASSSSTRCPATRPASCCAAPCRPADRYPAPAAAAGCAPARSGARGSPRPRNPA